MSLIETKQQQAFCKARVEYWNEVAQAKITHKRFYQTLLKYYYRLFIPEHSKILELGSGTGVLLDALKPSVGVGVDISGAFIEHCRKSYPHLQFHHVDAHDLDLNETFEYIILSDLLNDVWDAQRILEVIRKHCDSNTRLIINTHSRLWQPILKFAEKLGLAIHSLQQNWLAKDDIINLLQLEGFDLVHSKTEVLMPVYIPLISGFLNRFLVKLPVFKQFGLVHFIISRCKQKVPSDYNPGVSVVVAARNEEGNIPELFERIPQMGSGTEIIFVEGDSSDDTYEAIEEEMKRHPELDVKLFKQPGKGKGDAVRKGFAHATKEIFMILDADMTVSPEDLTRFYDAIRSGSGEYINGVRLVYPMEKKAMRFFNLIGNKSFSLIFSWILGQPIKDTLCGTKVLTRENYQKLARNRHYFGEFDPFGDFDLIFGAAKQNLKFVDIPIRYKERTYGDTNIQRWRSGVLLLRMSIFGARRLKFI